MRAELAQLLRRTGFGTTGAAIDAAEARGYEATVEAVLHPTAETLPPPPDLPATTEKAELKAGAQKLTLWWLDRMVRAEQPFVERLTFTWHGHWATSIQKVRSPAMMLTQNRTLRERGRGDFRELARAMVRDPALLVWLDGQRNKKGKPNENLARELMELFTLGVGHYSETDVREAARALTGWKVDRARATATPVPQQHDDGAKTVLGVTGELDDRGLIDLLVDRPESAAFVAGRLWSRLGGATLPADTARRLVSAYGADRDLTALLRALLLDPAFRADKASLIATPVEWLVGVHRTLRLPVDRKALTALTALGQVPFRPPSVGGWPGGVAWLSTAATRARLTYAAAAVKKADVKASDPAAVGHLLGVESWTNRTLAALKDAPDPLTLALVSPEYLVR
jgi:uncharacterized protein (DUF1800 family)